MELKLNSNKLKRDKVLTGSGSIPIIVDNVIVLPGYNMVRFIYFSIDSDDTPKSYNLKINERAVPFLLIEFQGIIHAPMKGTRFGTADEISRLFDTIEKNGEFFVDTNDIWIPSSLLTTKPIRGDVYRVTKYLFGLALKFRNDKIELENYLSKAEMRKDEIFRSEKESLAFNEWSKNVVEQARDIYPKSSELKLSFLETEQ